MRASEFIKEAQVKSIGRDANGLELSNVSGSGYKYVSMVDTPQLKGKYIAFAKIDNEDLQQMNIESGSNKRIPGYFGHKNTVGLAIFDDIRDAAYVGQKDASTIRAAIETIVAGIKKPTDADFMDAAEQAFAPYKK